MQTALASRLPGMRHVDISALAKAKDLFSGMDTERGDCPIIDEDKVTFSFFFDEIIPRTQRL